MYTPTYISANSEPEACITGTPISFTVLIISVFSAGPTNNILVI